MFIIFGSGFHTNSNFGPVASYACAKCKDVGVWDVRKSSTWATIFFIPIICYQSEYWLSCPTCDNSVELDKAAFKIYKSIAEINNCFIAKEIKEVERVEKINRQYELLDHLNETKKLKHMEEMENFRPLITEKTDLELTDILSRKKDDYNPAFLAAAAEELMRRNQFK